MPFHKDILLIDFETTGDDPANSEPIEIGAVLLDRATLAEKDYFDSLIFSDLKNVMPEAVKLWQLDVGKIKTAPKLAEVGKQFMAKFGFEVLVSSWVQRLDRSMLNKMVAAAGENPEKYDYHVLDLWPLAYAYLVKRGYAGSIRSDEMFAQFGVPQRGKHEALQDCRIEAEILRKIFNTL